MHIDRPNRAQNRFSLSSEEALAARQAGAAPEQQRVAGYSIQFMLGRAGGLARQHAHQGNQRVCFPSSHIISIWMQEDAGREMV